MSLSLTHAKPRAIEIRARESTLLVEEYVFDLNVFFANAKKVLAGETIPWSVPQPGRGSVHISMQALIENLKTCSKFEGIRLGEFEINTSDFFELLYYALTNTNLTKSDERPLFVKYVLAIDGARSYMNTPLWEEFVKHISTLKVADGFPSFTHGKRTNTDAKRLAYQF